MPGRTVEPPASTPAHADTGRPGRASLSLTLSLSRSLSLSLISDGAVRVRFAGAEVDLEVNGVFTGDGTMAIKMQIASESRGMARACPS